MFLERGYGERFGVSDDELAPLVGGLRSREELLAECDVLLLPKPLAEDLETLRPGQVVWGWPHCVQDRRMTQLAIDRRLTLIAWEAMNHWTRDGQLQRPRLPQEQRAGRLLLGPARAAAARLDRRLRPPPARRGDQLRRHRARRGHAALSALGDQRRHGAHPAQRRRPSPRRSPRCGCGTSSATRRTRAARSRSRRRAGPLAEVLAEHDVVVNCILQDTDEPLMFVMNEDLGRFRPGTLFVDVSCDEGMGFEWARPTSFAEPMFTVGRRACTTTPSTTARRSCGTRRRGRTARRCSSTCRSSWPGPTAWDADETIRRAIEIREGVVAEPADPLLPGPRADLPVRGQRRS